MYSTARAAGNADQRFSGRARIRTSIPGVAATSFYTCKAAGSRVGIGGVTELLTRLNDYRRFKNPNRRGSKTQLVISGHSFGGQVIYKAIGQILTQNAARMSRDQDGKPYGYEVGISFGDLVILVNPAFEGSAYETLQATRLNFPEQCFTNTNPECRASDVIPCDRSWMPRLEYQCESH